MEMRGKIVVNNEQEGEAEEMQEIGHSDEMTSEDVDDQDEADEDTQWVTATRSY